MKGQGSGQVTIEPCVCAHTCLCVSCVCVFLCVYVCPPVGVYVSCACVCVCVGMYVSSVCVCMCTRVCVCVGVYVSVCVYVVGGEQRMWVTDMTPTSSHNETLFFGLTGQFL